MKKVISLILVLILVSQLVPNLHLPATQNNIVSFADGVTPTPIPTNIPPIAGLDRPSNNQTVSGVFNGWGWFLDILGVSKIEVIVDEKVVAEAIYGLDRADVGAAYPQYNNSKAGFSYSIDTTLLTDGSHSMVIRETGVTGMQTSLNARSFIVSNNTLPTLLYDCDSLTKWTATNGSITLNTDRKAFGSASIDFATTAGNGCVSRDISSELIKGEKYYLVSAYLRNIDIDNKYCLRIMDAVGSNYISLCETPNQLVGAFRRVGVKLDADAIDSNSVKRELRISVVQNSQTVSQNGLFDGIMINEITEEEYMSESVDNLLGKYPYSGGTKQPTYPVKVGKDTAFVIREDGTVKAWGVNPAGQLGIGNMTNQTDPVTMLGLTDVRSISVGENHGLAVLNDGTVKAWGVNTYGQFGITSANSSTPIEVGGLNGVVQVAVGQNHSIALMDDGTVKAWGLNSFGQLGLGDNVNRSTPVTIPGLTGVKQIVAGYNSCYAVMNDGTVKAWGFNMSGRLGLGDLENRNLPTTIPDLINVSYLASGTYSVFAHTLDGKILAWGNNVYGQLGLGDKKDRTTPEVVDISGVKRIVAGYDFSAAIMNDGTVKTWGRNECGQLGIGNTTDQVYPQTILELEDVKILEIGGSYALAVLNDGNMKYWGRKIGDVTISSVPTGISVDGMRKNSSPVFGIRYPSSYTEEGVKASEIGTDGNCESTTGWFASNSTVALDTTGKLYGSNAIKGTLSGTSTGYVYRNVKTLLDISKYYFITTYVKSGSTNSVSLFSNFGTEKIAAANATTSYVRQGIKIQPSDMTTATEYKVGLKLNAGSSGQHGLIDNLIIVEITADEYAKLSEAQLMEKYSYKNLLESDGDCEEIGAWNPNNGIATLDATNKVVGNNGIKLVGDSGVVPGLAKNLIPLNTSKYYFFSGYGKSASGGNMVMRIGATYGSSATGGSTGNFTSSAFTRKGMKFKPTSTTGVLSVAAEAIAGQQHTVYFDGMMLREISQNEYNTLTVDQLLERYPYEGSKTEFAVNTVSPATLKLKSSDNNVVISVSDIDDDVLTCKLYVDDEVDARDTKVVSNSCQEQDVSLALGSVTDGNHLIKVEVWDGTEVVQYSTTVNAYYYFDLKSIVGNTSNGYYGLMTDGTVQKWGGTNGSLKPTLWTELSNVKQIVMDGNAFFAVLNDGTVKSWGSSYYLGSGVQYSSDYPMEVEGLSNVREIVASYDRRYAILNDGSVMAWGNNSNGGLGLGTSGSFYLPLKSTYLSNVERIVAGSSIAYAVCNGQIRLWGRYGSQDYYYPSSFGSYAKYYFFGSSQFMLYSNGELYACGINSSGQLGNGSTTNLTSFQMVKSNVKEVFGSDNSTFIVLNNGEVWACGDNSYGQLGLGDKVNRSSFIKVNDYTGASKFVFDTYASFAIFADGKVKSAGTNTYGTLGLGNNTDTLTPQYISSLSDVTDITTNNGSVFAYVKDGSVKAWGKNHAGILGLGDTTSRNTPLRICSNKVVPKIIFSKPSDNQILNGEDGFIIPSITVSSKDNELLNVNVYLDDSKIPYDSRSVNNSYAAKEVIFNSIETASFNEGKHTFKFEVSNGISTTALERSFVYDRLPSAGYITTSSSTSSITATGLVGIDSRGLNMTPIRLSIGSNDSGWMKQNSDYNVSKIIRTGAGSTKIVKVDSGYVAAINYGNKINFYKLNDNAKNWSNLGFINCVSSGSENTYAITAKGNDVYCVYNTYSSSYGYYLAYIKFNSNGFVPIIALDSNRISTGSNTDFLKGLSIALDNEGVVYTTWVDNKYKELYFRSNSYGIWNTPQLIFAWSKDYIYTYCGIDNKIISLYSYNGYNSPDNYLYTYYLLPQSKYGGGTISYNTNGYDMISPVGCQDNNGVYHAAWLSKDATDNSMYNVFYSNSSNGSNWSTPTKLTTGNTYNCSNLSICTDSQNRIHLVWAKNYEIQKKTFDDIWGNTETIATNGENPSLCSNNLKQAQPVLVYRDKTANEARFVSFKPKAASYTATSLLSGTKYTVKFETKDMSGNVAMTTKDAYTLAAVPSATIGTKTATTANISITDSNGTDTKYKVKVGGKYLLADGTLSTKADIIPSKSIKIKGLQANTTYQIYVKAVNGENIETKYSAAVALTTANTAPGIPSNIKTTSYGTSVKATWDELDGAQIYDVEVDSIVYSNIAATSFVKTGLTAGVSHNVRVRGVNAVGAGTWSSIYTTTIAASKSTQIPVNYSVGKIFNIVLSGGSLKDTDICTFKLTYDPTKLEVLDLCADTIEKELTTGDIVDTGIKVIEFNSTTGVVRYSVTKAANDGTAWTGALNSVKFRSKSTTPSTMTYILE